MSCLNDLHAAVGAYLHTVYPPTVEAKVRLTAIDADGNEASIKLRFDRLPGFDTTRVEVLKAKAGVTTDESEAATCKQPLQVDSPDSTDPIAERWTAAEGWGWGFSTHSKHTGLSAHYGYHDDLDAQGEDTFPALLGAIEAREVEAAEGRGWNFGRNHDGGFSAYKHGAIILSHTRRSRHALITAIKETEASEAEPEHYGAPFGSVEPEPLPLAGVVLSGVWQDDGQCGRVMRSNRVHTFVNAWIDDKGRHHAGVVIDGLPADGATVGVSGADAIERAKDLGAEVAA